MASTRPGITHPATGHLQPPASRCASPCSASSFGRDGPRSRGGPIVNRNDLLFSYPGTFGVKTGQTSGAGWSQVVAARRDGVTIYAVLLGGAEPRAAKRRPRRLLEWGFDQYRRVAIAPIGETYAGAAVPFPTAASPRRRGVCRHPGAGGQAARRARGRPAMVALPVERGRDARRASSLRREEAASRSGR